MGPDPLLTGTKPLLRWGHSQGLLCPEPMSKGSHGGDHRLDHRFGSVWRCRAFYLSILKSPLPNPSTGKAQLAGFTGQELFWLTHLPPFQPLAQEEI